MPAPPPESEPAIVYTIGRGGSRGGGGNDRGCDCVNDCVCEFGAVGCISDCGCDD